MMQVDPGRFWFQFGLSTWFVLIAIFGLAMAEWPWLIAVRSYASQDFMQSLSGPKEIVHYSPNLRIGGPLLALLAFLGWKWVQRVFISRRGSTSQEEE